MWSKGHSTGLGNHTQNSCLQNCCVCMPHRFQVWASAYSVRLPISPKCCLSVREVTFSCSIWSVIFCKRRSQHLDKALVTRRGIKLCLTHLFDSTGASTRMLLQVGFQSTCCDVDAHGRLPITQNFKDIINVFKSEPRRPIFY